MDDWSVTPLIQPFTTTRFQSDEANAATEVLF